MIYPNTLFLDNSPAYLRKYKHNNNLGAKFGIQLIKLCL